MKKIFFPIILGLSFAALFTGCEDYNDQFPGLDDSVKPTNKASYTYQLVDADYATISKAALKVAANAADSTIAKAIATNKYLSASALGDTYIPFLLATKYKYGDVGSSALITYSFSDGTPTYLTDFTGAAAYTLVTADYAASGSTVLGFYPNATPSTYLPTILTAGVSSPTDGKIELVKYIQYIETPVVTTTPNYILEENFDYGAATGNLTTISSNYQAHSSAGISPVGYATSGLSMTGYPTSAIGGAATIATTGVEDINRTFTSQTSGTVYMSALVNLSAVGTGTYFLHLMDDAFGYPSRIAAKDNGSGKILFGVGAGSTITYGTTPFDLNTTYLLVTSYNLATGVSNLYVLTSVAATEPSTPEVTSTTATLVTSVQKFGVRQGSGGPSAVIDGIRITKTWADLLVNTTTSTVTGAKMDRELYYKYSGSTWAPATGIYSITTEDYQSMGTATGQPGKGNYFSSSILPGNYIPTLLTKLYPFAQNGTKQMVAYKYSSGGIQTRIDEYTFTSGVWTSNTFKINKTEQFVFSTIGWVFDPTVNLTMIATDYKKMVDYVLRTPAIAKFADSDPAYMNEEFYYGFGSRYSNVSFRLSYRDPYYFAGKSYQIPASDDAELFALTTTADKVALMWTRLQEGMGIFLQERYPSAVPQVNGIDVYYNVTVKVYAPDGVTSSLTDTYTYKFKCTGEGTPATFEYVSKTKL